MKKFFSILAITAMFAFASCGDKADNAGDAAAQALADSLEADSLLRVAEEEMVPAVDTSAEAPADTTDAMATPAEDAEGADHSEGDH
jgi:hypothetical protein